VSSVAISADNSFIVTGSYDKTARVWDTKTHQCIATLTGHNSWVTSVAVSADNSFIVASSWDSTTRVWSIAQAMGKITFNEALALAIIPKLIGNYDQASLISFLNQLSIHELYSLAMYLGNYRPATDNVQTVDNK
jgi:WD40 repeat protein